MPRIRTNCPDNPASTDAWARMCCSLSRSGRNDQGTGSNRYHAVPVVPVRVTCPTTCRVRIGNRTAPGAGVFAHPGRFDDADTVSVLVLRSRHIGDHRLGGPKPEPPARGRRGRLSG